MPSMAYLLLPFKCLMFNLCFVFLCSNNRKRYGTHQYEHTQYTYIGEEEEGEEGERRQ